MPIGGNEGGRVCDGWEVCAGGFYVGIFFTLKHDRKIDNEWN